MGGFTCDREVNGSGNHQAADKCPVPPGTQRTFVKSTRPAGRMIQAAGKHHVIRINSPLLHPPTADGLRIIVPGGRLVTDSQ